MESQICNNKICSLQRLRSRSENFPPMVSLAETNSLFSYYDNQIIKAFFEYL